MLTVIGVDPDYHTTGLATYSDGKLLDVDEIRIDKSLKGDEARHAMIYELPMQLVDYIIDRSPDLVVVEGQTVYTSGLEKKDTIIRLSQIAGASAACVVQAQCDWIMPSPFDWKRNQKKKPSQRNIIEELGYSVAREMHDHMRPKWPFAYNSSHVVDAAGLALWGYKQLSQSNALREELLLPPPT